jgi:DNA sulfur modification protein DndD
MKIRHIRIENMGPYYGTNEINLETTKEKNIILIGGKNGAGKTTLLKSIKIGLFGSYAYGFTTNNQTYYAELLGLLNDECKKRNESQYSIEISFEFNEKFSINIYSIRRSWTYVNDLVNETVLIRKNGSEIEGVEVENMLSQLKLIYPPAIIKTSLFDGENISQLIDMGSLNTYLKEIFEVNFKLDYFIRLETDLNNYLVSQSKQLTFSNEMMKLIGLETEIKNLENKTRESIQLINSRTSNIKILRIELEQLRKKFKNYQGVSIEEKNNLSDVLTHNEKEKNSTSQLLRNFFEDDLGFYLNIDLLKSIKNRYNFEEPIQLLEHALKIEHFLVNNKGINEVINELEILQKDRDYVLNLEGRSFEKISAILNRITNESMMKISNVYLDTNKKSEENKEIRKIIKTNSENKELFDILDRIRLLENQINTHEDSIINARVELKNYDENRNANIENAKTLERIIQNVQNENNSFINVRKIVAVNKEILSILSEKSREKVSQLTCDVFSKIIGKKNYITEIFIDVNYEVTLKDNLGSLKSIDILSMGEKQLLVASIIFAIVKLSKRETTFVFDTPLARLDKTNRMKFVENIIKKISHQTIVLSTDSEIVGRNKKLLIDNLSSEYLLDYYDKERLTRIKKGYFDGQT